MNVNVFGVHISISRGKNHPQTVSVPDFTQEAKEQALRFVPKGNSKEAFLLSRFSHATGAMREFIRQHPNMRVNAEFMHHVHACANLAGQIGVFEVSAAEQKINKYRNYLLGLTRPVFGLMPDVIERINKFLQEDADDQ